MCPISGWIGRKANDSGRYPVVFSVRDGYCDRAIDLPCGRCVGCYKDRAEAWAVRCYHESTLHAQTCFATLTYRDPCPPKVSKPDLQAFFKRLRNDGTKFRYFACGEYGGRTRRPHYHVLFFGQDFLGGSYGCGEYYVSPYLEAAWGLGNVMIAPAEAGAIFYTTGYQLKNMGDPECFYLSSRQPAIGAKWLAAYWDEVVRNGFVTIDGRKHPVPGAYMRSKRHGIEFDPLKDRRRVFVESMTAEERWQQREQASARQVNLEAAAAHARGEL